MPDFSEARLAELEAAWPIEVPVPEYSNGPIGPGIVIHELIALVKQAWRERDDLKAHGAHTILKERADRAEAEVERLRIELGEIKLVLDSQDMRLHRYHAVREAAEAYLTSTERCSNEFMSSAQDAAWKTAEENLRCILDACAQDPAR